MELLTNKKTSLMETMQKNGVDAWLLYSFHGLNDIAERITDFHDASRRWFLFVDAQGSIKLLCQSIEEGYFKQFNIPYETFSGQEDMRSKLKTHLGAFDTLALEYSPLCSIPYISKVDAGTVELLKEINPTLQIVSSAELVQQVLSTWTEAGTQSHTQSLRHLHEIIDLAWKQIRSDIDITGISDEFSIQQLILNEYEKRNLETNHPPVVAVGRNSADAHYAPTKENSTAIAKDQVLMIDVWAREKNNPEAIYADITWMGFTGTTVPDNVQKVWDILINGRNAGVHLLKEKLSRNETVQGWEVDEVVRKKITEENYGQYFTHRTGHSIAHELHAEGVNMDNFELHDTRSIIRNCGFSIEPGIYIPDIYGMRSELDVHIDNDMQVQIHGPVQEKLITL